MDIINEYNEFKKIENEILKFQPNEYELKEVSHILFKLEKLAGTKAFLITPFKELVNRLWGIVS